MAWTDLVLLMDVIKAPKVKGLFPGQPFNGIYTGFGGVDAPERRGRLGMSRNGHLESG